MQELSKDVVALLQYLVPGFLVAWVYYGFTSHPKPSQFERVVQALVFTAIVQVVVGLLKLVLEALSRFVNLGPWTEQTTLLFSLLIALLLGFGIAAVSRQDVMHALARRCGLSRRTGHPNEHYAAFAERACWVVLQLKDGTRLFGWPLRWPTEADKGHYLLEKVERSYIDRPDESPQDLIVLDSILVPAIDVQFVEFVKYQEK